MESRGSVAGMLAAAVFAAAVFAASMALAVRVLMMVTMHGRVEIQRAVHQRFRRSIRIAADAAEQADACIGQRGLCAAADAAADQRVHAALHQEARQRAVPAAVGIHDFGTDDLPVLYIVELEPVSYTHLDVYKRQMRHSRSAKSYSCLVCTCAMLSLRSVALPILSYRYSTPGFVSPS